MAKKTVVARGKPVEVEDLPVVERAATFTKKLIATVGETTVEHMVTFGAEDGPRPLPGEVNLQKDLDAARALAAQEAAWKEELREQIRDLQ